MGARNLEGWNRWQTDGGRRGERRDVEREEKGQY